MKKKARNQLRLPKDIVRALQVPKLEAVANGATDLCGSCGNPPATRPV